MKMTAQVLLMCRKQFVFERVCSIIQPASVMREDGFILAKRKIDFLTQEMKDRERARKEIETERQTERESETAYVFNHAQRQSWLNVHSFNFEIKIIKWQKTGVRQHLWQGERDAVKESYKVEDRSA